MCENKLEEERSKGREREKEGGRRKTVVKSKHGFTCQTDKIQQSDRNGREHIKVSTDTGLCLIAIFNTNKSSSLKVFFPTSVTREDQLNVGGVISPLQASLEFIVNTD